jgi:hypothetical protein
MVERRRVTRTRILAPAAIIQDGSLGGWGCFVRDITALGARLEIPNAPIFLPTAFDLTFDCAKTLRPCQIVWRASNEVGVAFFSNSND